MSRRAGLRALAVLLLWLPGAALAARYEVALTLEPVEQRLHGHAIVHPERGPREQIRLSAQLSVVAVRIGNTDVGYRHEGEQLWVPDWLNTDGPLVVVYEGRLQDADSSERSALAGSLLVGRSGSFLPDHGGWYPSLPGPMEGFLLDLTVADGHVGVAPGALVEEERSGSNYRARFRVDHPIDGMVVAAGPYRIGEVRAGGTLVRTYFHDSLAGLSEQYLATTTRYLKHYSDRIGSYPYPIFSVVSSPLPVGLGYPYLTYISDRVLRLPFILHTSLPHEIVHSWWGNGVFVDYANGNWAEGLTTFLADYGLADDGARRDMRLRWLADYAALPAARDGALRDFRARVHGAAQVVGYHKAAMLFDMLHRRIGDDAFAAGLREIWSRHRFRMAGWNDLFTAFEAAAGQDLGVFRRQWVERVGAPQLSVRDARIEQTSDGFRTQFTLLQGDPPYELSVPVRLTTQDGSATHHVGLARTSQQYSLVSSSRPTMLSVDPDFQLFRRLPPGDAPAVLRQVMLAETVALEVEAVDAEFASGARALADALSEGRVIKSGSSVIPLLLVGRPGWFAERIRREPALQPPAGGLDTGTARVWVRRSDEGRLIAMISAADAAALAHLLRPLPHYGSKSFIVFDGRRAIRHGLWSEPPRSTTVTFE